MMVDSQKSALYSSGNDKRAFVKLIIVYVIQYYEVTRLYPYNLGVANARTSTVIFVLDPYAAGR